MLQNEAASAFCIGTITYTAHRIHYPFEGSSTVLVQTGLGLLDTQTKRVFNSKLSLVCKLRSYHDVVEKLRKQSGYLTSPEVIIKIVHVDKDHMFISDRKKRSQGLFIQMVKYGPG